MKTRRNLTIVLIITAALILLTTGLTWAAGELLPPTNPEAAVGTGFTYQGYLTDGGSPANDDYDLSFYLYDDEFAITPPLGTVELEDVPVEQGFFTVLLDFGSGAFDGDERWLQIYVRLSSEAGSFTSLADRQPINPTPYALYAVEAGSIGWLDIDDRPPGLDDGDDSYQYDAGFGLELDTTTFNVMTDTLQARVAGSCAVGSYVRVINPDGSVECQADSPLNRNLSPTNNISTTIKSAWHVGKDSSITIGSDGLPILSYTRSGMAGLKVAHCEDAACTSVISNTLDTAFNENYTSITIGTDGLPIISYTDDVGGYMGLKVAHCNDTACASASISAVDTNDVGQYSSITIGSDGLPIISYYDLYNQALKTAHCNDTACTSASTSTLDNDGNVGFYTSIAIGRDGLPIISYWDGNKGDLKTAHCVDTSCTSASINTLDSIGDVGRFTSITIGSDSLPIISYQDNTNDDLVVAHCDDAACTSAITSTLDITGSVGSHTSITIGSDGLPVISYREYINGALKFAHCDDVACTSAGITTLNTTGDVGKFSSITIGTDGLPIISYYDDTNQELKVIHCSNVFCVPYWRRR